MKICSFCNTENEDNAVQCVSCGANSFKYKCDNCGWQPADPTKAPRFCPECGDPFDNGDII